ncbi:MAG: hypothetical protein ACLR17_03410 [Enterobacteriaceae bacterium]
MGASSCASIISFMPPVRGTGWLITGLTATHSDIPLLGISVALRAKTEHNVWRLASERGNSVYRVNAA